MIIGTQGYVVNDALIRAASEEGLNVYQALFFRSIGLSVLFAAAAGFRNEQPVRSQLRAPLVVRVVAEILGTALFFAALVRLEFANAQTILLLVPFAVTLTAAIHLGESVSVRQYLTVAAGFVGVLAVVRPTAGAFSPWALVVIASALALVVREFATRRVDGDTPPVSIALLTALAATALTGVISAFTSWGEVTPMAMLLVSLGCICLVAGYLFTIQTVRVGDLSVSAPFRYTALIGAVIIGITFFDESPDAMTITGCIIIVLAGIYSIYLERAQAGLLGVSHHRGVSKTGG